MELRLPHAAIANDRSVEEIAQTIDQSPENSSQHEAAICHSSGCEFADAAPPGSQQRPLLAPVRRPPSLGAPDLVAAIAQQAARDGLADTTAHLNDRQYHPTDSHPPTIQRIEALGIALDQSILDHATRRPDLGAPSFGSKAFANWDGFCRALSSDFTSEAQGAHARYRLTLEKAAEAVDVEEVVLFNNAKPMVWTLGISAILFAIVGVAGLVFSQALGFGHAPWAQTLISVVCSTVAVAFLSYAWVLHRDGRAPLMVLTPDHLVSYRLREPIEWASIENYVVYADHRFALCLTLDEASPLPTKLGFSLYTKVHRRRRLVTLGALGIRGVKPQEFSDLIGRYVQAAHARRQLASTKTGGLLGYKSIHHLSLSNWLLEIQTGRIAYARRDLVDRIPLRVE